MAYFSPASAPPPPVIPPPVTVSCKGRRCPTPRTETARRGHTRAIERALSDRVFHPGERPAIAARAHGFRTLRAVIRIRTGRMPALRR